MQAFKENDQKESRVASCFNSVLDLTSFNRTEFFDGAYSSHGLGRVLFNLNASPMASVVDLNNFLEAYPAFHELFTRPGTFEFYIQVIRSVWGEQVGIEFIIPSPGILQINIDALDVVTANFSSRSIENNVYVYDNIVDHVGDSIVFQTSQGIKTQTEAERMMRELHPQGVFVETNLIIT